MKKLAALLAALWITGLFVLLPPGIGHTEAGENVPVTSVFQLNDDTRTIGVSTGTQSEVIVMKYLPQAQLVRYNDPILGYLDVAAGKLDAFVYDRIQMERSIENGISGVTVLEENLPGTMEIAVGISRASHIPDLKDKINQFLAELRENGTLDDMYNRWVINKNENMPDISVPEKAEISLTVGTSAIVPPYSYYKDNELNGYDIELARRFAAWLGAELTLRVYDYSAFPPALASGDLDCVMADLQKTVARAEVIDYSDNLFIEAQGVMVRDAGQLSKGDSSGQEPVSFWQSLSASFEKTFLKENRWRMLLNGLLTTLLITVASILCGTVLGFAVYLLYRKGNRAVQGVAGFLNGLIMGMPLVVLLLILYYVIFASVRISGVIVSIIAFTLIFGAGVLGMLRMGVGAVDSGQYEAARAMGYTDRRTFFRIILPQAMPHILPALQGETVSLIKATAVVGYISVQDLTKMGDIIRSSTYEAFFPLIAITVIYFGLEGLIILLIRRLRFRVGHRDAKEFLKGVRTDDQG